MSTWYASGTDSLLLVLAVLTSTAVDSLDGGLADDAEVGTVLTGPILGHSNTPANWLALVWRLFTVRGCSDREQPHI